MVKTNGWWDSYNLFFKNRKRTGKPTVIWFFRCVHTDMHSSDTRDRWWSENGRRVCEMIRGFAELGYKKLITTPACDERFLQEHSEIILNGLDKVREALHKEKIPVTLEAAGWILSWWSIPAKFRLKNYWRLEKIFAVWNFICESAWQSLQRHF